MGSGVSSLRTGTQKSSPPKQAVSTTIAVTQPVQDSYSVQNVPAGVGGGSGPPSGSERLRRGHSEAPLPEGRDELTDRILSGGHVPQTPAHEDPGTSRSNHSESAAVAEMFAHTALSLGMDNEDLLFNLMYFSEAENATLGSVMEGVQHETLALHSQNNTPYKLKPASERAVRGLHHKVFGVTLHSDECECQVCKDEIEVQSDVIQIPSCQHFFHEECLLRWIKLQGWCPVCRADITAVGSIEELPDEEIPPETPFDHHRSTMAPTTATSSQRLFIGDDGEEGGEDRGGHAEPHLDRSPREVVESPKVPGSQKCVA